MQDSRKKKISKNMSSLIRTSLIVSIAEQCLRAKDPSMGIPRSVRKRKRRSTNAGDVVKDLIQKNSLKSTRSPAVRRHHLRRLRHRTRNRISCFVKISRYLIEFVELYRKVTAFEFVTANVTLTKFTELLYEYLKNCIVEQKLLVTETF